MVEVKTVYLTELEEEEIEERSNRLILAGILVNGVGFVVRLLIMAVLVMWGWNAVIEHTGLFHLPYDGALTIAFFSYFLVRLAMVFHVHV